jgi:orotate phosphoribosyltransferase
MNSNMVDGWNQRVAQALLDINAVGFTPDFPIRFKSGILSPVYVDNRRLPFHPSAWHTVIMGFQAMLEAENLAHDVIAGVAVGGIPHSSALAYQMNKPSVFVRKETKGHGTQKLVEGGDVSGARVLLVEDLVTTGSSSLEAVAALRSEGANVQDVLAVVSYGFEESKQAFSSSGVSLYPLTTFQSILQVAEVGKILSKAQVAIVTDWLDDPYGWGARHEHV